MPLPENIDTTYADSGSDASVKLHQQYHDSLHDFFNTYEGYTPASFDAAGAATSAFATATDDIAAALATAEAYTDSELASAVTDLEAYADAGDAATLASAESYADSIAAGLAPKEACDLATAAALPACTYNNGSSGVGATLTGNSNGALTVDGTSVVAAMRVLVKDQASAAHNGIYDVTTEGDGSNPFVLTRATDMDAAAEIDAAYAFVQTGTANTGAGFVVIGDWSSGTVGTTAVNWSQFSSSATITAGTGLTLAGSVMSLDVAATSTALSLGTAASRTAQPTASFSASDDSSLPTSKAVADYVSGVTSGAVVQAITLANGTNNNVALNAATTVLRITGPTAAFTITGFQNPTSGRRVLLVNTTAYTMKLMHLNTGTSTAANRMQMTQQSTTTGTSSNWDVLIGPNHPVVEIVYDATSARWRLAGRIRELRESPGIAVSMVGGANDNERLSNANAVRIAEGGKVPIFLDQPRTYSITSSLDITGGGAASAGDGFELVGMGTGDHNVRPQTVQINISGAGAFLTGLGGVRHVAVRRVALTGSSSKGYLFERTTSTLQFPVLDTISIEGLTGLQAQTAGSASVQGMSVQGFCQWINCAYPYWNMSGADHFVTPVGCYMSVQTGLASWHNSGTLDDGDYIMQWQGNHSKLSGLYLTAEILGGVHVGAGGGRPYETEFSHSRFMGRNGDTADEQCRGALIWIDGGKSRFTDCSIEFAMSSPSTGATVNGADAEGYVHMTSGEASFEGSAVLRANAVSQDVPVWYVEGSGTRLKIRDATAETGPDGGAWTKRPIVKVDRTSGAFADVDRSVRLVEV